ncbi:uncharacterized protein LOC114645218 [Erpetoichthys calabaricus]|uniref:uncharacterized protein LOC114645218 n=1 Tax=Erpetoichthys calabaricus TaxID=27687 RepID=UPI002233FF90|nr:uncharacterized protein LOC114645218 [Erpetoichthys calabaricus]
MGPDGAGWSMGQVLGFSHCKEFGSVSTTPDSSPSSTEGGNDESEFPELQTAHDWSAEDDDDGRGSPLVWGTPRQNSYELTFSYITFAEPQGSPSRREPAGCRRPRRERPAGLRRTDTTETLLPEDTVDGFPQWDPAFSLMEDPEPWDSRLSEDLVQSAHGILDGHFHLGTRVLEMNGQEGDREILRQNPDVAACPLGSESGTSGRVSHSPEYHTTYMALNFSMESGPSEDKDLGIRCSHPRGQETQVAPIISQSEAFGDGQQWTKGESAGI